MEERIFIDTALCNGAVSVSPSAPMRSLAWRERQRCSAASPAFAVATARRDAHSRRCAWTDCLRLLALLPWRSASSALPRPRPGRGGGPVPWRRSCRNYKPDAVAKEILEDLARIGTTAPSGTNSQGWNFIILPERRDLLALGGLCADFVRRLNSLAASSPLRLLSWIFAGDALGRYHRKHLESVAEALRRWDGDRRDLLFHGASAAILVTGRKDASCPARTGPTRHRQHPSRRSGHGPRYLPHRLRRRGHPSQQRHPQESAAPRRRAGL